MNLHRRINFKHLMLVLTLIVVVCVFFSGCSVKPEKMYRVGIISGASPFESIADGFKEKMTELGYIEAKNITYDFQKLPFDPEKFRQAANKFVENKVDMIVTFPTEPSIAAKAATQKTNIPVVFVMAGIEHTGLVENIRQPGGNITGVRYAAPENMGALLTMLQELVPQARRVYLVYDPDYPTIHGSLPSLRSTASNLGITLVEDPIRTRDLKGLQAILRKRAALDDIGIDAMMMMPDIINNSPQGFGALLNFANEHNLPFTGGMDYTVELGCVFGYVPSNIEQGRAAATLADKIFKGTPAGTIPVVTPVSRLLINYKAIQKLGLTAPEGLLSRANEIIR